MSCGFVIGLFLSLTPTTGALAAQVIKSAPKVAPTQVAPPATQMVAAIPDVFVKNIQIIPAQPKVGEYFEVRVELFNKGKGATGPGQKYILGIAPGGGNSGPFPLEGIIAPNQSHFIVKKYVFMEAGDYAVAVRPVPGPSDSDIKPFKVVKAISASPTPAGSQAISSKQLQPPGETGGVKVQPEQLTPKLSPPTAQALKAAPAETQSPEKLHRELVAPNATPPVQAKSLKTMGAAGFSEKAQKGLAGTELKRIPFTRIWVEKPNIDGQPGWGDRWQDATIEPLDFKWITTTEQTGGIWEVAVNPQFNQIIKSGSAGAAPAEGKFQIFNIDFRYFDLPNINPATFYVRVKPFLVQNAGGQVEGKPSLPVQVTFASVEQGDTQFVLPTLYVAIQQIEVVDDSDDLSAGDLWFKFTLEGAIATQQYEADIASGDSVNPNITFRVENPDQYVTLHVHGCDNDTDDGDFGTLCDSDWAMGDTILTTGTGWGGLVKEQTPFAIYAGSGNLDFWVRGVYWVE
jgi:hypothetical protein